MGLLKGAVGYLSGPIEYVADHGVEWRKKFIDLSKKAKLGILCIDPCNKPEIDGWEELLKRLPREDQIHQRRLQEDGKFEELREYVSSYRRLDLRLVDYSDFIVVVVDPSIPQWGTANEVYMAEAQHKPLFFICPDGMKKLPRWLFDVIDFGDGRCNVFESVEEVIEHLIQINDRKIKITDEWVLIRQALEKIREESES